MAGLSIDGLFSGFDTTEIIDAILDIQYRGPIDELEERIDTEIEKISAFQTLSANLLGLGVAAQSLASTSPYNAKEAISSDETAVTVSVSDSASVGNFTIQVDNTAKAEQISTDFFSSGSEDLGISGEFVLNGKTISVDADDSLSDIANSINYSGAGISANVVQTSASQYRLVLSSTSTGFAGIEMRDVGSDEVLQQLTLASTGESYDYTVQANAAGAISNEYTASTDVPGLAGTFEITDGSGRYTISVTLDGTEDIDGIAAKINTAAAGTNIEAEVIGDGPVRLQIGSTAGIPTRFADADGVLAGLGVVAGRQSADFSSDSKAVGTLLGLSNAGSGTITIDDGEGQSINVTIDLENDSLEDIKAAIEAAVAVAGPGTDISANILEVDGKSRLEITGANGYSPILTDDNNVLETLGFIKAEKKNLDQAGENSEFRYNGVTVNRTSNVVSDLLNGVTIGLLDETSSAVSVRINENTGDVSSVVDDFVTAYNNVMTQIEELTYYDSTTEDAGLLLGDSTVRDIKNRLANLLGSTVADLPGISLIDLNDGNGVDLGTIKITDRAGNRAEIDLSSARTVQDVLTLINSAEGIEVEAKISQTGKGIQIVDKSGSQLSALEIRDAYVINKSGSAAVSSQFTDSTYVPGISGNFSIIDPADGKEIQVRLTGGETVAGIAAAINTAASGSSISATVTGSGPVQLKISSSAATTTPIDFEDDRGVLSDLGVILSTGTTALDLGIRGRTTSTTFHGSQIYEGGSTNLAAFGVSLQSTGQITFDSLTFENALSSDPDAIKNLFTASDIGIGDLYTELLQELTFTSTGTIDTRINTITTNIESFQDSIDRFNERAETMETVLRRQYTAMETAMAESQNLTSLLTQQLGTNN